MGHQHDRDALVVELLEQGADLDGGAAVEVAGGFVRKHDGGLSDQSPGDGHALLLAARELARLVVDAVAEADTLQRLGGEAAGIEPATATVVQQRQLDVAQGRGARQQVEALEDEADLQITDIGQRILVQGVDPRPVERIGTRGRVVEAAEDIHQGGLAGTRRAHDGEHLASPHE